MQAKTHTWEQPFQGEGRVCPAQEGFGAVEANTATSPPPDAANDSLPSPCAMEPGLSLTSPVGFRLRNEPSKSHRPLGRTAWLQSMDTRVLGGCVQTANMHPGVVFSPTPQSPTPHHSLAAALCLRSQTLSSYCLSSNPKQLPLHSTVVFCVNRIDASGVGCQAIGGN